MAFQQCSLHNGHADGDAVAHLVEDDGLHPISHACRDLKAADDGARMQDDSLRRLRSQPLPCELVVCLVLLQIELQTSQAFGLNAQHHDCLRLAQRRFEIAFDGDSRAGMGGDLRQQLFRAAEDYLCSQAGQQKHVGTGYAAVQNVADDGNRHSRQRLRGHFLNSLPQMRKNRPQIEQRLGGMLMHAVAGIEHGQAGFGFQQPGRAGGVVAQDDCLGAKRAKSQAGVLQRLAFFNA